jgi:hypothetical protein
VATKPEAIAPPVATEYYAPLVTDSTAIVDDSSPPADRVKHLLEGHVVPELNALAWLEPFNNSADHGKWDPGWSCRDHAVVLAALLTAQGVDAQVVHGANIFIQGATEDGQDPTGLGNILSQGGGHTWTHALEYGAVDVSPRLDARVQSWRPLPVSGLTGADWSIPGIATRLAVVNSASEYQKAVDTAIEAVETATAIYWPKQTEQFRIDMFDAGYIDSPLAHRLTGAAGSDCYIKLGAHLYGMSQGVRRSLARVSQPKAWRYLNEVSQELIEEFREALTAQSASS